MAANFTFPVLKYSHSMGAAGTRSDKLSWTHMTSDHMFVNLNGRDTDICNGLLEMTVIRGTTTLESIDLATYIDSSARARENSQPSTSFFSSKEFALQLTYPLEDQVRRIQLRFQNIDQCRQVVRTLQDRGMEFRQPRQNTNGQRPDTARSDFRPLTAQSSYANSPYFTEERLSRQSRIQVPDMEAGSLSARPATRPGTAGAARNPSAFDMTPPKIMTRDGRTALQEAVPSWPTKIQLLRSTAVPSQPGTTDTGDYHVTNTGSANERPSLTSHIANVEAILQSAVEDTTMDVGDEMRPPSAISGARPSTAQAVDVLYGHANVQESSSSPSRTSQRPGTALSSSSSRPGSSKALMMAPLPKPKLVQNRTATPSYDPSTSITRSSSPVRPASALPSTSVPDPAKLAALASSGYNVAFGQHDIANARPSTAQQKPTKSSDVSKAPLPLNELLARNRTVQRVDSLADAPHEIESPPQTANGTGRQSQGNTVVDRAYNAVAASARFPEDQFLEQYSLKTPEDRLAIMDQFVIDNLENPSFTTLCEDVEKCWRRISMGL